MLVMKTINPSAGSYSFTYVDDWISNAAVGSDFVFVLGAPADYLVSRTAVGGAFDGGKSNMCPDTLTGTNSWTSAVTALVEHIVTTWGVTGMKWELWNEFSNSIYYGDTISLLGPYAKATAQAILAVDPTAVIISPSISQPLAGTSASDMLAFLTNSDGASGTGATWISGMTYHCYRNFPNGPVSATDLFDDWQTMQQVQKAAGISMPTWITESGYATTDAQQALDYQRCMMFHAGMGAKCYIGFCFQDSGDSTQFNIQNISSQWNTAANLLTGSPTISAMYIGPFWLEIVINGQTYVY